MHPRHMTAPVAARVSLKATPLTVLLGGILALLVAMGIGRFAYTLLLPLMQAEAGFGARAAGWLASANYLGYFAGSLSATAWPMSRGTRRPLVIALAASALTTLGMALTASIAAWVALRFLSGVASGWVFVFTSALVLTHLRNVGRASLGGWLYAGVGAGIALTSVLSLIAPVRDSTTLWLAFGALSGLLLVGSALALPKQPAIVESTGAGGHEATGAPRSGGSLLLLAYSLEGIGYIVSATFIVAVIASAQGRFESGAWAWLLVGLAGIPACVAWTRTTDYRGIVARLASAYWIQAAGIVAIALAPASRAAALLSAATLGATLTGVVLLTMQLAPLIDPEHPRRTVGRLTTGFSAGQMSGPVLAGYATEWFGSYMPALLGSAALLCMSALASHALARRVAQVRS
jgi:predicted MFS family arabinose efflux permease